MDTNLIEHVLVHLRDVIASLRGRPTPDDGIAPIDDLCDLELARQFAAALLHNGTSRTDLLAAGEVLQLTSDVMIFHRRSSRFGEPSVRLPWSYSALFARTLALAFIEAADSPEASLREAGGWKLEPDEASLAVLASRTTSVAIDRVEIALSAAVRAASALEDLYPFQSGFEELAMWMRLGPAKDPDETPSGPLPEQSVEA